MNTTCTRCKRPLHDPESVAVGMGPICRAHGYMESDMPKREEFADVLDDSIPFRKAFVMKRNAKALIEERVGGVVTNVPHLVVHHSTTGYEFGYSGSGPADLALNACQLYLNIIGYEGIRSRCYDGYCWTLAWILHHDFKDYFVANVHRRGDTIPFGKLDAWFKEKMSDSDLMRQCAIMEFDKDEIMSSFGNGKYVIYSQIEDGQRQVVDVLDDKEYAEYLCDWMNEFGGDYIKYWVAPAGVENEKE